MNSDTMPSAKTETKPQFSQPVVAAKSGSTSNSRHSSAHSKPNSASFKAENVQLIKNQPFDEVIDTFDTESDASIPSPDHSPQHKSMTMATPKQEPMKLQPQMQRNNTVPLQLHKQEEEESDESGSESEEDSEDEDQQKSAQYNPADYLNIPASQEIKELFEFITAYKPHDIELETKLKPFIPEYTPAVGDLDPFLKVPRPDGKLDLLGLKILDEPAAKQSDPAVVQLSLNYVSRDVRATKPVVVNSIESAEKNPKKVQKWIDDIRELHRTKPPPSVHHSKPMPDIEALMQAWPDHFEEVLNSVELPGADIDIELEDYVRVVCAVLDIPVYTNIIESLHLLFALFLEFKQNAHFSQQLESTRY
jgi:intraflagellar transport protein 46